MVRESKPIRLLVRLDNASVNKARSIKWFVKVQSLVPHLTNAFESKQTEILTASFQYLVKSLPSRLEVITVAKGSNSVLSPMALEWDVQQALRVCWSGAHILLAMQCVYTI